jgi:hypothetical protein
MPFCCAFVLLVGLARARCPHKSAYVRRAFDSTVAHRGDMRSAYSTCSGAPYQPNRNAPNLLADYLFICGKPLWYGKPLKQLGLLSRHSDIHILDKSAPGDLIVA